MAPRKTRKPPVKKCPECQGTGHVSSAVLVGRKRRLVGQQSAACLTCWGSGEIPADD
ncbi:hypothetical protein MTQ10_26445 [Streptomyces sp. XM83C]|uniref:hypothetical protein n=1 Tax=unclassified Streptomyces TaxID=2593676 RepID=UPI001FF7442C|nr:hypothetical protein [Streptomyces sp. XM83C]MCK1823039.1 hypothetical protein [Streptomyces sp. XM83C]